MFKYVSISHKLGNAQPHSHTIILHSSLLGGLVGGRTAPQWESVVIYEIMSSTACHPPASTQKHIMEALYGLQCQLRRVGLKGIVTGRLADEQPI